MSALRDDVFVLPTSLAQRRYWQLDQMLPGNPALNMPLAFDLAGPLDVPALERALDGLRARHEILRCSLERVNGELAQVVRPAAPCPLKVLDLSAFPKPQRDRCVEEAVVAEAQRPFALATGPLFRASLVRRSETEHVLLVTMHHAICDGWSNGIVVRETAELYRAAVEGDAPGLPELTIQFADFANWQREWLGGEKFEEAFAYWRKVLAGPLPALEIPTDRPRRAGIATPGRIESLLVGKELSDALKTAGRQMDATPFMLFFSAFVALLGRWSGQEDVLLGSPAANRQHVETEGLIGPFANPLLLRTDLSGSPTLRALVLRVKELALSAFAFAELPFEKLVEWQEETLRQVPYAPRVMFIYQAAFMQPAALPGGLTITPRRSVSPGSAFELMQSVVERAEGQRLQLEYNPDLFDAGTMARFLRDFEKLLRAIATTPDALLADVVLETTTRRKPVSGEREAAPMMPALVPARDDVEKRLVAIWEDALATSPIGVADNYFELGGHSLLAVRIMSEIGKAFGKDLPLATLVEAPTIGELAELLRDKTWSASWSSLVPIQTAGTRLPFYCVHAAGGNVLTYLDLARHLGPEQPVYGLQARGLDGKQAPHESLEAMARDYIKEIREFQPTGPYALGGTSFGGLIAFEMAQQLVAQGQDVALLALFDTWGPDYPRYVPGMTGARRRWRELAERVDLHVGNFLVANGVREKARYIVAKSVRVKNNAIKHTRKHLGRWLFTDHVARPLPRVLRKVEGETRDATKRYVVRPYPGRITLFRASRQGAHIQPDPDLGWTRIATGGLDVFEVPGHHGALVYEPRVGALARQLAECLEAATRAASSAAKAER